MASLKTPIVVTVTGEGGSGGALALGVGDRVFMLEHSIYSVISPEGCAAILWKDQNKKSEAATALKLTAQDLSRLEVIDGIIEEPLGGAHTDPEAACRAVGDRLESALRELGDIPLDRLLDERYRKFRALGSFERKAAS